MSNRVRRSVCRVVPAVLLGSFATVIAAASPAAAVASAPYEVLKSFPTAQYLEALGLDPVSHRVYASGNTQLTTYDGVKERVVRTTTVGGEQGVGVDPATGAVFVSAFLGRSIQQVDPSTGQTLQTIETGYGPSQIAVDTKSHTLFVANAASGFGHPNGVSVVSEGGGIETTTIPVAPAGEDDNATTVAFDQANHRLYVARFHTYKIAVIDTASKTLIDTIDLGPDGFVNGIAIDKERGRVWVTSGATGKVLVIKESTNKIIKRIPTGYSMWGIAIHPEQGLAIAADQNSNGNGTGTVYFFDLETETKLSASVLVGGTAHAVVVDPDLDRVYVSDIINNRVVVLGVPPRYGPGTISYSSRNYTVVAGSKAAITVKRVGRLNLTSTVKYKVAEGSATSGTDFVAKSGTLTFAKGESSVTFSVTTKKHGAITRAPTVKLTLGSATGGSLRDPHSAVLHLLEGRPPLLKHSTPPDTLAKGKPYSYTFTATGSPKPRFSVSSGTLPTGLSLNATTGTLAGTPTKSGTPSTFKVRATNGLAPTSTSQAITLTVRVAPKFTAQSPPTTATVGTFYSYNFTATGTPAPTFALASGSLPPSMVVTSNGFLGGTPQPGSAGHYTFTVKATNGASPDAVTPTLTLDVSG